MPGVPESGPFFDVVKATEIRRSKETDWSFAQFVGFSEKVQIMQDSKPLPCPAIRVHGKAPAS